MGKHLDDLQAKVVESINKQGLDTFFSTRIDHWMREYARSIVKDELARVSAECANDPERLADACRALCMNQMLNLATQVAGSTSPTANRIEDYLRQAWAEEAESRLAPVLAEINKVLKPAAPRG